MIFVRRLLSPARRLTLPYLDGSYGVIWTRRGR